MPNNPLERPTDIRAHAEPTPATAAFPAGPRAEAPSVALAIMAKFPAPGRVKTRLSPPLTPAEAADLALAFLLDKIAQVSRLPGVERFMAFTPPDASAEFRTITGGTYGMIRQAGADLGERLSGVSERLLATVLPAAAIVGTDSPTLSDDCILEAVDVLAFSRADVVLGPAEDGGYYLIGLRRPSPFLFRDIAWGTPLVLRDTLARAETAGLRVHLLPAWYDVDTDTDLRRLARELAATPEFAPHTARCIRALRSLASTG
jgi:uncharacterized protein